jgi:hypothetical protein
MSTDQQWLGRVRDTDGRHAGSKLLIFVGEWLHLNAKDPGNIALEFFYMPPQG